MHPPAVSLDERRSVLHTTSARGHLRANIERERRVCFEIDEQEGVFDYGRFECDSGLAYRSVCLFGRIRIVDDREVKQRFCESLMAKYGKPETKRPKGFFPRIDVKPCTLSLLSASLARNRRCRPFPSSGLRKTGRKRQMLHCARTVSNCPNGRALQIPERPRRLEHNLPNARL